jgi:L-threonylcarbamoyladenylate synthase
MNLQDEIIFAARLIREGKLVAFPTETVYGLGANALNPLAVARIFEAKNRPSFDPLIVHIADFSDIEKLTSRHNPNVCKIAEKFWPGALTMILPKSELVPDIVTAGLPSVGIRIPANNIALAMIRQSGCPVAAPSANRFGRISPTTAAHVKKQLPNIDYILDGGKTSIGIESTIIRLTDKGFQILRNGAITKEDLETILPFDKSSISESKLAPGMLKSHYSPAKKMVIADKTGEIDIDKSKAGLLSFSGEYECGYKKILRLTENKDLKSYAVNMFEAMHLLEDDPEIEAIIAEPVPEIGIGKAIMDRLRKAAYNWQNPL